MLGVSQSRDLKLFGREIIFEEFQRMWSRYLNVTDGRTDRRHAISSPRSALASRGKNWSTSDLVIMKTKRVNFFETHLYRAELLLGSPQTFSPMTALSNVVQNIRQRESLNRLYY